ncbi:hypothetical protein B2J88_44380 [Rhodococcus sp. SRB_17]|nr:hypothetical protein [Rhodococcus sp. SRB_17]
MSKYRAHNPTARWSMCERCNHHGYYTRDDAKAAKNVTTASKGWRYSHAHTQTACSISDTDRQRSPLESSTAHSCANKHNTSLAEALRLHLVRLQPF